MALKLRDTALVFLDALVALRKLVQKVLFRELRSLGTRELLGPVRLLNLAVGLLVLVRLLVIVRWRPILRRHLFVVRHSWRLIRRHRGGFSRRRRWRRHAGLVSHWSLSTIL